MSYIDVTGKTEDEALRKGLEQLGMDRDDVSVSILERAKTGFLGIGATPARIRITYGPEEADVAAPAEVKIIPETPATPKAEPKTAVPAKPAAPKADKPRQDRQSRPDRSDRPRPEKKERPAPVAPAIDLPECDDDNAKRIIAFVSGLLQHMDSAAEVKVYEVEKGRYKVILVGERLGQLIGHRGETLDAIQQLTNYAINTGSDSKRVRVQMDAENYRARREQSLESLARKVATKVQKYRRSVTLEPMNAYERHVIHAALQDVPGVNTRCPSPTAATSVVVSYDRAAGLPRRRHAPANSKKKARRAFFFAVIHLFRQKPACMPPRRRSVPARSRPQCRSSAYRSLPPGTPPPSPSAPAGRSCQSAAYTGSSGTSPRRRVRRSPRSSPTPSECCPDIPAVPGAAGSHPVSSARSRRTPAVPPDGTSPVWLRRPWESSPPPRRVP